MFFFDNATGELLQATDLGFNAYQYISSNILPVPDTDKAFEGALASGSIQIYALANLSGGTKFKTPYTPDGDMRGVSIEESPEDDPYVYEINNRTDLLDWVYCPVLRSEEGTPVSRLPKAGMPMIGERVITAADYGTNKNVVIPMKALMARVDINVKLNPENESSTGLPRMTITEYGVKNMPKRIPFVARTGGTISNPDTTVQLVEKELTEKVNISIDKNSDVVRFHYYTYENVRQPDWTALRTDGSNAITISGDSYTINYPEGVKSDDSSQTQRWKPTIARDSTASAMVLKAVYTTHQNLTYNAQFTVFMGENTYDNFEVHRNRQYVNNISIRGLDYVRNSDDGVYSFDGRVNVITDNPLYIAIVNERKVDAHASVLPMDLFFLIEPPAGQEQPDSYVDVYLYDPETQTAADAPSWIRMEKINSEIMRNGGKDLDEFTYIRGLQNGDVYEAFSPGTGARKYFTDDLVTWTLSSNTSLTVGRRSDGSQSRVYFYIDENIPTTADAAKDNVPDRMAKVYIVYRNKTNGDVRRRILEIEQRGLLRVAGTANNRNIEFFIEYYEEYMSHNDPLDKHMMPGELYEGLPWVSPVNNQPSFATDDNYRDFISGKHATWTEVYVYPRYHSYEVYGGAEGYWMTDFMMNGRSNRKDINLVKTYNRTEAEQPPTAFHYCYGKNKRTSGGAVVTGKSGYWFLPGITDMELAMEKYYTNFPEFKENWYWSASSAKSGNNTESRTEARATMTDANGNHLGSGNGDNQPGRQARTILNRIRAGYIYLGN